MIYEQYQPKNITTDTTTLVKTGSGLLHTIVINTKGTSTNTIAIYDGLTAGGTLLGTIDGTQNAGTLWYDCQFSQGLCIVTGGSGTCADITCNYR